MVIMHQVPRIILYIESSFTQSLQPIPPVTLVLNGQDLSTVDGNTVTLVTPTLTGLGTTTVSGSFPSYSISSTFNQTVQPIPASSLAIIGNSLSIVGSNTINLPVFTQTIQSVNLSLNSLSLSAGFNTVVLPAQVNQSLSISGQTVSLTNGGNVTIPTQTVPVSVVGNGATSISGSYPNFTVTTPAQTVQPIPASTLAISGNTLSIVGSNSVNLPTFSQSVQPVFLSLSGQSLSAGTNTVILPIVDAQTLAINNHSLSISNGNTIVTPDNQALSISGQTISLVNGGNVTIPTQTVPVTITSGNGVIVSGSFPNFTVSIITPTITVSNDIVVTGTWPNINISQYIPTTYTVTRSMMTGTTSVTFSISTRQASVDYNVNVDQSATLSSTQSMTVFAEYSTNGGSTWIGQDAARNSLTYGLSVTLGNVVGGTLKITGTIPGSALVRIRTTGTGTPTYVFGKETY